MKEKVAGLPFVAWLAAAGGLALFFFLRNRRGSGAADTGTAEQLSGMPQAVFYSGAGTPGGLPADVQLPPTDPATGVNTPPNPPGGGTPPPPHRRGGDDTPGPNPPNSPGRHPRVKPTITGPGSGSGGIGPPPATRNVTGNPTGASPTAAATIHMGK